LEAILGVEHRADESSFFSVRERRRRRLPTRTILCVLLLFTVQDGAEQLRVALAGVAVRTRADIQAALASNGR
jgi:hypothetical protein